VALFTRPGLPHYEREERPLNSNPTSWIPATVLPRELRALAYRRDQHPEGSPRDAAASGSVGPIHSWQVGSSGCRFSVSMIAHTAYLLKRDPALLERRMRAGLRTESRRGQRIIQAIVLAMFVALVTVPGLDRRFGWSHVPAPIVVIANVLVMAAFGFILLVFRENTFAASTITVEAGQRVISTGPYAHLRPPMYAAGALMFLAMPVALGSLWGFLPPRSCPLSGLRESSTRSTHALGGACGQQRPPWHRRLPIDLIPLVW
jgi:protein-S-isoprenylcysteine O-methyltransferase Ste14